jgi:mono/diheme cytochrome c family protein
LPGDEANTPKRQNRASHFDHGPNLWDMGAKTSKAWIYSWLREPRRYNPVTRMPSLRLSPQEALDIATYLATLKGEKAAPAVDAAELARPERVEQGKALVKQYGCYGCHQVEGFETTPGIGADLSAFGVKLEERLDFGDYITNHTQQTWNLWTINKLRHPRVYSYNAQNPVQTLMPQFDLAEHEVRQVMVFLRSLRRDADRSAEVLRVEPTEQWMARERGRTMVRRFNCNGCHAVDGHEGELASLPHLSGSESINGPPPLTAQGLKTQPSWLFGFLKAPFRMRPLPKVRMPTFGFDDAEANTLVRMFSAMDGARWPFTYYGDVGPVNAAEQRIGKALFEAAGCQQCHVVGALGDGPLPPEVKAPNLLMGQERLRPEWLSLWLADPGALQKNTAMPAFWLGGNQMEMFLQTNPEFRAAVQGIDAAVVQQYASSPQLQIEATRNYLFRLEQ